MPHHYFANLLPEANRIRICRERKISVDNDFELLRAIGGECAGAFSILGDESEDRPSQYRELSDKDLTDLLVKRNPSVVVEEGDNPPRLSLAGAQDKAPVKYENGRGHYPNMADKTEQKDPGLTGCTYADEKLLPAIRASGRFVDQEMGSF